MPNDSLTDEELMQLMNAVTEPEPPPVQAHSKSALRRLYPDQARDVPCPKCNGRLELKDGRRGLFYGCANWIDTRCQGSVDADQATGQPLGTDKNWFAPFKKVVAALPPRVEVSPQLTQARNTAKNAMTRFYKNSGMEKSVAQNWLKTKLGVKELSLASFDEATCNEITRLVKERLRPRNRYELIDSSFDD